MKKIVWTIFCCYAQFVYACDFCGCSPSVMNSDLLSLQAQSSVGINTSYRGYKYSGNENGLSRTHMVSNNLVVSYAPKKWAELRMSLPLIWMMNQYPSNRDKLFGLGDMVLLANFRAVNKSPIGTSKKVGHTLMLGFGIELPTGKNRISEDNQLQNFTLGSRSADFLFSGVYSMSYRKWTILAAGLAKINTRNKEKVRYGHLYSIQTGTVYTHTFAKSQLMPNIGLRVEVQQKNLHGNILQTFTGGYALFLQYGLDWSFKTWNIGAQLQHPVAQHAAQNTIRQTTNFLFKVSCQLKRKPKIADTQM